MTTQTETAGQRCLRLTSGEISVDVALDVGPRILGFSNGGPNTLAELPDTIVVAPGLEPYRCWGGHRLWVAPEIPEITYETEDDPVEIREIPGGLEVSRRADSRHGIHKSLRIAFDNRHVVIDHTITNTGTSGVRVAPWAITQFPVGGTAIMTIGRTSVSPFQASRGIVLWPYTSLEDPRLTLRDELIAVDAVGDEPLKVGAAGHGGWLAYRRGETVFVKEAEERRLAPLADMGATAQIYAGPEFLELETLGALEVLRPGTATDHRERWSLHTVEGKATASEVAALVELKVGQ